MGRWQTGLSKSNFTAQNCSSAFSLHSQEFPVTEFNNVKGTTHAKIDVMKALAVVACMAGCSSVQSHHITADWDEVNSAGCSPAEGEQGLKRILGHNKANRTSLPSLRVSKNNISHYIHGYKGNLSRMVCKPSASRDWDKMKRSNQQEEAVLIPFLCDLEVHN